jgi:hypothetical protein
MDRVHNPGSWVHDIGIRSGLFNPRSRARILFNRRGISRSNLGLLAIRWMVLVARDIRPMLRPVVSPARGGSSSE